MELFCSLKSRGKVLGNWSWCQGRQPREPSQITGLEGVALLPPPLLRLPQAVGFVRQTHWVEPCLPLPFFSKESLGPDLFLFRAEAKVLLLYTLYSHFWKRPPLVAFTQTSENRHCSLLMIRTESPFRLDRCGLGTT